MELFLEMRISYEAVYMYEIKYENYFIAFSEKFRQKC